MLQGVHVEPTCFAHLIVEQNSQFLSMSSPSQIFNDITSWKYGTFSNVGCHKECCMFTEHTVHPTFTWVYINLKTRHFQITTAYTRHQVIKERMNTDFLTLYSTVDVVWMCPKWVLHWNAIVMRIFLVIVKTVDIISSFSCYGRYYKFTNLQF